MTRILERALIGGFVGWIVYAFMCHRTDLRRRRHSDELLDDALDDTFPASDPIASQDFSIPANRL